MCWLSQREVLRLWGGKKEFIWKIRRQNGKEGLVLPFRFYLPVWQVSHSLSTRQWEQYCSVKERVRFPSFFSTYLIRKISPWLPVLLNIALSSPVWIGGVNICVEKGNITLKSQGFVKRVWLLGSVYLEWCLWNCGVEVSFDSIDFSQIRVLLRLCSSVYSTWCGRVVNCLSLSKGSSYELALLWWKLNLELKGFVLPACLDIWSCGVTHHVSGRPQVVEGCPWKYLLDAEGLKPLSGAKEKPLKSVLKLPSKRLGSSFPTAERTLNRSSI